VYDEAFSQAAAVVMPVFILRMPLLPYSVGHELCLKQSGNPLAAGMSPLTGKHEALFEAVLICSQSWREIKSMARDPLVKLKMRIWAWRARRENLQDGIDAFCRYRFSGYNFPQCSPVGEGGRIPGSPVLARMIQFLMMRMGKTEEEAMDYPLGLAHWHFATWLESEGSLTVQNENEKEFADYCEEEDRKALGGDLCPA
jgi:hypothetical protein